MSATIFFSQGKTSHELPFIWSGVEVTDGPTRERLFRTLSRARQWREITRSQDDLARLNWAPGHAFQRVLGIRVLTETRDDAGRPLLLEGILEVGPIQKLASELDVEVGVLLQATREAMIASQRKCEQSRLEEALVEIQNASRGRKWPWK
jgi:hypothetical protein